jgi:hypothetical protein
LTTKVELPPILPAMATCSPVESIFHVRAVSILGPSGLPSSTSTHFELRLAMKARCRLSWLTSAPLTARLVSSGDVRPCAMPIEGAARPRIRTAVKTTGNLKT